ncbi:MAG: magnesium transporter CorA family protein [Sporomusaceae bacterium]|nr:magnesium transporter CorA family protein [Sporomusaceae bacterium]
MLRIYKTNCETLRELSLAALEKGAWLNLTAPDADELAAVADLTGVPPDALRAALDEEERSRVEIEDNYILVITNVPTLRDSYSYDTLPLGIVLTKDHFITVCLESHQVLEEFAAEGPRTFSTYKKTRFLFQILYKSAILYLKYLKQINRRTDEIERDLRQSVKNQEIFQLLELQKGLTYFTASLRSNGIVLERLLRLRSNRELQHLIAMYEEDEDLLEDVIIENKQAIEMVEMYSNVLSGMMGAFTSIISNNLNLVLKFLAAVTILLAIPTMVASFWGMNVGGLPFSGENGFAIVLLIAVAAAGVSAYGLWRRGLL